MPGLSGTSVAFYSDEWILFMAVSPNTHYTVTVSQFLPLTHRMQPCGYLASLQLSMICLICTVKF